MEMENLFHLNEVAYSVISAYYEPGKKTDGNLLSEFGPEIVRVTCVIHEFPESLQRMEQMNCRLWTKRQSRLELIWGSEISPWKL